MASPFLKAELELGYPGFAVQYDPEDADNVYVGGGGGYGVPNKISLINTASEHELRVASEMQIPKDEDSVMSLAVGPRKGKTTHLFAGVNSSADSIAKGKNEHMRTIAVEATGSAKTRDRSITEIARTSMFSDMGDDGYQRLVRVAGSVGIATTGLLKNSQLAVFDATMPAPSPRGVLDLPREAFDIDIIRTGVYEYSVAWCYKYELWRVKLGKEENTEPELVFEMPDDNGERPEIRSIRFLSPTFILLAANIPNNRGAVLHALRLPGPDLETARLAASARVKGRVTVSSLALTNLTPPSSPGAAIGNAQFVIAVGLNDSSIAVYTVNHRPASKIDLLTELFPVCSLKHVHNKASVYALSFSPIVESKDDKRKYIKLASTSLENDLVVHSMPLKRFGSSIPSKDATSPPTRYVLAKEAQPPSSRPLVIVLTIMVLIMAIVGQSLMEVYGKGKPILGVQRFLPSWHGTLRSFDPPQAGLLEDEFFRKLAGNSQPDAGATLVMWEAEDQVTATVGDVLGAKKINLDVHDHSIHGPGQLWEELPEEQKEAWKAKLKEAGAWTQGMGESVFKGILFGQIAEGVRHVVGG
jgi:hypothetical protein